MPGRRVTAPLLLLGLALFGCASRGHVGVLESQLRVQEDQIHGLEQRLSTAQSDLETARHESQQLRNQLAQRGHMSASPEHFRSEFRAVGIAFNSYLTSGIDRDGIPGDEMLSVMVYPHDDQGGLVKLAGDIEIRVLDLNAPSDSQTIGQWQFTPVQTRDAWQSGVLSAGFLFELPWQHPPVSDELTLHVVFKSSDGRSWDATRQIQVRPLGKAAGSELESGRAPVSTQTRKPAADLPPPPDGLDAPPTDGRIDTSDVYREWEIPKRR